ncbi:MAG: TerB family tellurite resistance protein [Rhodospirillales bacterium]|nr:TerB family tellurite resistance protein [Rhodospirillales bacterium]MDE0381786.1 TerB family tellurite resistance protein [Rhodospirillales bacterium]
MIDRIKILLRGVEPNGTAQTEPDAPKLAAAALLVEAACMDGHFDGDERDAVCAALGGHFGLSESEAETLIEEAEAAHHEATDLHRFTRTINDRYDHGDRLAVMEMLWEVVYADGRLHAYEANLIRRVGGLLHITDRERGEARKRVLARVSRDADQAAAT